MFRSSNCPHCGATLRRVSLALVVCVSGHYLTYAICDPGAHHDVQAPSKAAFAPMTTTGSTISSVSFGWSITNGMTGVEYRVLPAFDARRPPTSVAPSIA